MCFSSPKAPPPPPAPTPPPPPAPVAPQLPDSTVDTQRRAATARKSLRIDLQRPSGSGLNIPM